MATFNITVKSSGVQSEVLAYSSNKLENDVVVLERPLGIHRPGLYARLPNGAYQLIVNYSEFMFRMFRGGASVVIHFNSLTTVPQTDTDDVYINGYKTGSDIPPGSPLFYALITDNKSSGGGSEGGGGGLPSVGNITFQIDGPLQPKGVLTGNQSATFRPNMEGCKVFVSSNDPTGTVMFDVQAMDLSNPLNPVGFPLGTLTYDLETRQTTGASLGGTMPPGTLIQCYSQNENFVNAYVNLEYVPG